MNSGKANPGKLIDVEVNIKVRLSLFWVAACLCYLYGDYFELYVPHKFEGLLSGNNLLNTPARLFAASLLLAIPALMVFLSIFLKPTLNRWLNITFGLLLTTVTILIAVTTNDSWRIFYRFLAIVESVITAAIVWSAWKWPLKATSIQ